jgi:hypothetical protein
VQNQSFLTNQVVFTCVVGDRHALTPVAPELGYEHVLYVDRDVGLSGWNERPLLFWDAAPKLITLFHKYALCSLMPAGIKMLWLDSRVTISPEVAQDVFGSLDTHDLCLMKHYERDCVYEEILAVLEGRRSTAAHCEEFSRHLRELDFPRGAGLFETGMMAFKSSPQVAALFRRVFGLCYRHVPRDQLALPVALQGSGVSVRLYADGASHLRNSPGIELKSWQEVG